MRALLKPFSHWHSELFIMLFRYGNWYDGMKPSSEIITYTDDFLDLLTDLTMEELSRGDNELQESIAKLAGEENAEQIMRLIVKQRQRYIAGKK